MKKLEFEKELHSHSRMGDNQVGEGHIDAEVASLRTVVGTRSVAVPEGEGPKPERVE